ncbi:MULTISPECIES: hypothetical protein [Burkholderia]|uniref:Paraquat-inducible protein A n=1 Tax=Burkholderia savannae TaxID=1637837 RepID=A0ABR5T3L6_9BURK|nr:MULTISPECIES: hypothetical protein [Burkholderia]AOJ71130.1 hypothetical protein WS78_19820 [Burkholderia savannae]AOJ84249.1 hypothetical protein WS86_27215 [Burkholderia savannae]AOK49525.1 hypothetical protein WT60_21635 [Burkholderia sp. MSMB617WGS]KGS08463.1 hypothetical protein X946_446 [Burkholderia sp. ABCPW 111]KVG48802.1 hypothetical protein WS77_03525 [Burkholderia sp. MSMB0265]
MHINCISCGHQIEVDDDSYARYHGALRCWVCHSLLMVDIVEGCVESVRLQEASVIVPHGAQPAMRKPASREVQHDQP